MKKYRLSFDIRGLLLFLVIMIPNFIWFAVPAPNDILRAESMTAALDTIASVCQVSMVVALCIFSNQERSETCFTPWTVAVFICCLLYFASWIAYYLGIVNVSVILGLTIPPCLSLLFYAIDRKNMVAVVPISIFTICHLIYAIVNYII
ncbi:MAG: hypothetical protein K2L82_05730 [Lachnospiraceae bacterium]|nr:hypothetical protein [Lachnospiraceae bacterium]